MKADFTDITVVMDRSGSMQACQTDAEGGLNNFIEEQKKVPGEARFSLVQFDTEYEFVHKNANIQNVGHCVLEPRGWTALHDAVGRAISETGERLKKMDEKDRPGLVVFVIITDGQENSSKEYTLEKVQSMIKTQQDAYKWKFIYLGATAEAFAAGVQLGIQTSGVAQYAPKKMSGTYRVASSLTSKMRDESAKGADVLCSFTPEERKMMEDD